MDRASTRPPSDLSSHLSPFISPDELAALPVRPFDVAVIGAGVAGLTFVLRLPGDRRVALLTKGVLGESNTRWAQGGLSAAIGPADTPELHETDTLVAGAGLCDPEMVDELVRGAPEAVEWLVGIGADFDRDGATGALALGREAAHSRRRVLHAGGDATGAEIERALVAAVCERPSVTVCELAFAVDLIVEEGVCVGVVAELAPGAALSAVRAPIVVLAAGGAGQLWVTTSNPPGATADGLALALRAGAALADLEFAQFHPTVLALPGEAPFLISEAVRGEGAFLRGADGGRFMAAAHPLAELAPRDVVARGIQRQMAIDGADHVDLDLRHLDGAEMRARFPTIARELALRGLDLGADLIPVAPAAHYFMGGVAAGADGRTSLPGLLALGEAACSGVHGANRLASNSLLEGLVFGARAAQAVAAFGHRSKPRHAAHTPAPTPTAPPSGPDVDLAALRDRVQRTMSRDVAVVRDAAGLAEAARTVDEVLAELERSGPRGRAGWEMRDLALAARAVIAAATLREESRGAHFRSDFAETAPELDGRHLLFGGEPGPVWRYGAAADARPAGATIAAAKGGR
ncbi:MAG: L-aspartate oxidase [Thermomicrobiales bacterium]